MGLMYTYHGNSCEKIDAHDYKITVNYVPGWLGRKFRREPFSIEYIGSCTVWYEQLDGGGQERCSTLEEEWLHTIWQATKIYERTSSKK